MGQPIDIVAQYTMDAFYRDYKGNADFFDIDDFIYHCGATAGDYFRQEWAAKYAELKAEKSESMVTFGDDLLLTKTLKAKPVGNGFEADIDFPVLSFTYDTQNLGIQSIFSHGNELERTSANQRWQLAMMPVTNRVFWYVTSKKIYFYTKGPCNVGEFDVSYIPGIGPDMIIPDGIVKYVIDTTVGVMRQLETGIVVKESNDGNRNKIMESEINKAALK